MDGCRHIETEMQGLQSEQLYVRRNLNATAATAATTFKENNRK
jgi:hypothetical protein